MPSSLPPASITPSAPASLPAQTATEALYRAALAEGDIAFYLPVFAEFDERGVAQSRWNPAAGLLNLNWLLYRRLWRAAAVHTLAFGLLALLVAWVQAPLGALGPLLWLCLVAVAIAVPGFRGTAWLHNDVRRRMTAAVRRARTVQEACDHLRQQDRRRPVLLGAVALQAALVVLAGIDTPWRSAPAGPAAGMAEATETTGTLAPAPAAPVPPPGLPAALVEPLPGPAQTSPPAPPEAATPAMPAGSAEGAVRPRLRGFGVNVGLFADPGNAGRVRQRLVDAGLPVLTDPVESARGTLTRIRVGPFDDEAAATRAADRVRAVGLEARVFRP